MNDINISTGYMMPNAFVHITCYAQLDQDPIIKCTWANAHGQLTCMHCRFYKEFLTQTYFQATHQTAELPRAVTLVQDLLSDMNMEIQLVGNVVPISSTKFSVKGTSSFSIVSLTFPTGKNVC